MSHNVLVANLGVLDHLAHHNKDVWRYGIMPHLRTQAAGQQSYAFGTNRTIKVRAHERWRKRRRHPVLENDHGNVVANVPLALQLGWGAAAYDRGAQPGGAGQGEGEGGAQKAARRKGRGEGR